MNSLCSQQRGSIAIIAALTLSALIGMMALAIDLTRFFVAQSQLQVIADSCALGAMTALPCAQVNASSTHCVASDYALASEAGQKLATLNQISGSFASVLISFPQSNTVQCQTELQGWMPTLLQVLGLRGQDLQARAISAPWPQQPPCLNCGTSRFAGALNSQGNALPVLVQ